MSAIDYTYTRSGAKRFTFEHDGYTFACTVERDDDMREPWIEHDGHGIVSEWTRRDKRPGERVLIADSHGAKRYYDVAASIERAKAEEWGCPDSADLTRGQIAAKAVDLDFEHLRAWCAGEWEWEQIAVRYIGPDRHEHVEYLGGIIDPDDTYKPECARELADEIIHELAKWHVCPTCQGAGRVPAKDGDL